MVKVAILRSAGANCNNETEQAFKILGAETEQIHINRFMDGSRKFDEFDVAAIPGGFSYGDYMGAGKILACQLALKLKKELEEFVAEGRVLIGICNGFQALVKAGLLPGDGMKATLTNNDSGNFECRWVKLIDRNSNQMLAPVAHGEGKFLADDDTLEMLEKNGQIMYRYSGSEFPENPNGSLRNIAGISNREGNVMGLMPHPERHLACENHPEWIRAECREADGLKFFRRVLNKTGDKK